MEDQRRVKGEETKHRIIDAAFIIVSEEGVKGLSATKIANKARVSKSSVFHHFPSIDDIPKELIKTLCSVMTRGVTGELSLGSFFQLMGDKIFLLKGEELVHYRAMLAFNYEAMYCLEYRAAIKQLKQDFVTYLIDVINDIEGVRIPASLAELIVLEMDALGMHYLLEEDSDKYLKLWELNSQVYIQHIRRLNR